MRLLVFNCHEAWIHQLEHVPARLDIVDGLAGRDGASWNHAVRPVPVNATLVSDFAHLAHTSGYDCVVAHNLTDLLAARPVRAPRLLVLHATLEGRQIEEGSRLALDELRRTAAQFLRDSAAHAVAISDLKARSWGLPTAILRPCLDVTAFPCATGELARGIRVVNHIERRKRILRWDVHEAAFAGLPVTLVGHNPGLWGVGPARSWDHLKLLLRSHRFVVHTTDPALEDGYNLALLEAMACGLPVVGTPHPSSPAVHGESGLLSDDPAVLRTYAERLMGDRALALEMGARARHAVARLFPVDTFVGTLLQEIERARTVWARTAHAA
jgi:hypothetical protein